MRAEGEGRGGACAPTFLCSGALVLRHTLFVSLEAHSGTEQQLPTVVTNLFANSYWLLSLAITPSSLHLSCFLWSPPDSRTCSQRHYLMFEMGKQLGRLTEGTAVSRNIHFRSEDSNTNTLPAVSVISTPLQKPGVSGQTQSSCYCVTGLMEAILAWPDCRE